MDIFNTPGEHFDEEDVNANKGVSYLAYIIFLIPLLAAPDSKFARFHSNQGLILFLTAVAFSVFTTILSVVFGMIPLVGGILGTIAWLIGMVAGAAVLALAIIGLINVSNGLGKELPVIGKIRLIK
jgi:uncharacterized membrane protein